ncbi:TetR/AcrR family transcriptional regulator [Amycolatopsis oliviviridis]|uniref:TetR family transcriptional regulator n=1 Tax=Amycolatopsis oliviviridis TaxID=1471590 RepID=A0ABQ3LCV9_9PSEU|nr:TetR/AcrR family transcriptional regulator [Amycolatopsis oliviviridis]GHH03125.1 TetR family transcriptional regulator [Amycolatopsis oliviviridis]
MSRTTPRARNAAATRQAILEAAITAFTRHGYDGVGLREIAATAGVTAILINRYFGSKEALFTEVVDISFAQPTMVPTEPADSEDLAVLTARALVERTAPEAGHLGPFELLLKSAANPRAAEIMREGIRKHVGARFTDALPGAHAGERAELGLALLAGTWLMRRIIGTPALRDADPGQLTAQVARVLSAIVEPPPAEGEAPRD